MADEVKKDYLLSAKADTSGFTKFSGASEALAKNLNQLGFTANKNLKILDSQEKVFVKNGQTFTRLTQVVQNGQNQYIKLNSIQRQTAEGVEILGNSLKAVSNSTNIFSKATGIAGVNLGQFASRALITSTVFTAVGAAIFAFTSAIGNSIKFMIDFEAQLAEVQAVSGSTKEEVNKLGEESLKLASKFGTSFADLGEALSTFAQLGFSPQETLAQLEPVLEFALVSGRKLGDVVQDLIAIQNSFNLTGADTVTILDSITKVQLKYAITTAELSAGLRRFSPAAASVGLSLNETIGLITGLQEQTRKSGDETGTALANLASRLQSTDIVGKLQGIIDVPLFMDKAGQATAEFTGRVRPANEILAILASRFKELSQAEQAELSVAFGGRQRFIDAAVALQNYDTSLRATIDSIASFGASAEASKPKLDTVQGAMNQLTASFLENVNVVRPWANEFTKAILQGADAVIQLGIKSDKYLFGNKLSRGIGINKGDSSLDSSTGFGPATFDQIDAIKASEQERSSVLQRILGQYDSLVNLEKTFNLTLQTTNEQTKSGILTQRAEALASFVEQAQKVSSDNNLNFDFSAKSLAEFIKKIEEFGKSVDKNFGLKVSLQKQAIKVSETDLETQNNLKKIEEDLTAQGKSRLFILEAQLEAIEKTEGILGQQTQNQKRKIQLERDSINNKIRLLKLESESNIIIQKAISNGETDIQIQQRKVAYAQELKKLYGDQTTVLMEQNKLQELIAQKVAESSKQLQSSISSSLSTLLQGEGNFTSFFDEINKKINSQVSDAISENLVSTLIGSTGVGSGFGGIIQGILNFGKGDKSNEPVKTPIIDGHVEGATKGGKILADQITSALTGTLGGNILSGVQSTITGNVPLSMLQKANASGFLSDKKLSGTLQGVRNGIGSALNITNPLDDGSKDIQNAVAEGTKKGLSSTGSGGLSGLFSKIFGSFKGGSGSSTSSDGGGFLSGLSGLFGGGNGTSSGLGGVFSAGFSAFNAISQFKQGNKAGGIGGLFSTAGDIASLFPGYGTAIGGGLKIIGGLVGLFRKPKKTVTEDVQTRETQVASKIEITNKKLDYVNRNLIALKQSFDTFVLPESAYFAESRNLADQFSVNARRGLA